METTTRMRGFALPVRGTQRILRFPVLFFVGFVVALELIGYVILRMTVLILEWLRHQCVVDAECDIVYKKLKNARNYKEYIKNAKKLDIIENRNEWKLKDDSFCYDVTLVNDILNELNESMETNNFERLTNVMNQIFHDCLNWFETEALYSHTYFGTKKIVNQFFDRITDCLLAIRDCDSETEMTRNEKIEFFSQLQQSYGRTALCLSGGATMTYYQFGAVKALLDNDLLPKIISGTSGGSLVGSVIAVRTDNELKEFLNASKIYKLFCLNTEPFSVKIRRFLEKGHLFDWNDWRNKARLLTNGDITFLEAYKRTGRIFNVTAVSDNHKAVLLNYRTAPDVVIWSAVICSASIPLVMSPSPLIKKSKNGKLVEFNSYGRFWRDGTIASDLPTQRLLEDFNVKFNIAIQCNPHIISFIYNERGSASSPVKSVGHSQLRGGFVSSLLEKLLKLEMRKWAQLMSELDLVPQLFGQDWRHLWLQATKGQITMCPDAPILYYFKLISDATETSMKHYFKVGQAMAFPYLEMIKSRLVLQNEIRKHISHLDNTKDHSLLNGILNQNQHGFGDSRRIHTVF